MKGSHYIVTLPQTKEVVIGIFYPSKVANIDPHEVLAKDIRFVRVEDRYAMIVLEKMEHLFPPFRFPTQDDAKRLAEHLSDSHVEFIP